MIERLDATADHQVVDVDGTSIVFRCWGAGPQVLLVHGASGAWTHWVRNIDRLAAHHRVIVPDLPGFGESDLLPGPHAAEPLAAALVAAIDSLLGADTALDLVGFSFGGIIAGLSARLLGARARKLILVSVGGIGMTSVVPPGSGSGPRADLIRFMFAQPASADELALRIHLTNMALTRFRSGSIPASTLLADALPQIRAEVHAIYSDQDAFGAGRPTDRFDRLRLARHDVGCHTIAGSGHWIPYEKAEELNTLLLDLL